MDKESNFIMCYCYISTVWVVAPSTEAKKEEKTVKDISKYMVLKLKNCSQLYNSASETHILLDGTVILLPKIYYSVRELLVFQ